MDLKKITAYCEKLSSPPSDLLIQLERETHLKTLAPQMISGHIQGALLSLISEWVQPQAILEIGTFTGYGTLCLSKGLRENGTLHTIEVNPELTAISRKYFLLAGIEERVQHYIGDAQFIIPAIDELFDLVFIDAGKREYQLHYDLVFEKVKPGGIILADNVLWSGKVSDTSSDKDTEILKAFNQKIKDDSRVRNLLLPIRDGLMIAIKN
ncbi:MAG: O-methyltransferase [Saprospiraceae bacterium]